MENKREIIQAIEECWNTTTPQSLICMKLVNYLEMTDPQELEHISQASIQKILGNKFNLEPIIESIQFLAGNYIKLLDINFEFIDENDDIFPLERGDIAEARKIGVFAHPTTGDPVDNFEEKVFLYYQPNPKGLKALKHG
ncbi:MAG: hypothetical protein JAY74_23690 [Candidatus Thiodiazotropha taylori]|nr:hypothetical protein [Candidatus Thiodiazotropha taylori]